MDGTNDLEAPLVLSDTAAAPGVRPSVQFRDAAVKEIPDEKKKAIRQLGLAIGLCFIFMVGEIVGGVFSGSIAIMTDAAHMLSDVTGLIISIVGLYLANAPPSKTRSFGWKRAEVFSALMSILVIWILTAILVYEAIRRVREPEDVDGRLMFIIGALGFGVNIALMKVLHQGHGHGGHGDHDDCDGHDDHEGHEGHGHAHGGHDDHDDDHHGHAHAPKKGHGHSHGGKPCTGDHGKKASSSSSSSSSKPSSSGHGHSHGGKPCSGDHGKKASSSSSTASSTGHGHSHGGKPCTGHGHAHGSKAPAPAGTADSEGHGHSHGGAAVCTDDHHDGEAVTASPAVAASASASAGAAGHGHSHSGGASSSSSDEDAEEHHGHGHGHGHSHSHDAAASASTTTESAPLLATSSSSSSSEEEESGHGHSHGGKPCTGHGHAHGSLPKTLSIRVPASPGSSATAVAVAPGAAAAAAAAAAAEKAKPKKKKAASHHGHSHDNMNVRAAFIHAVGDLLQSIGVMVAAGLIWYEPEWRIADPICTFIFSVLVLWTTVSILQQALVILLESVPAHIDFLEVFLDLQQIRGVSNVHDLHIWSLNSAETALAVHLVADDPAQALRDAQQVCQRYNIDHSTIQVERCGTDDLLQCYETNKACAVHLPLQDLHEAARRADEELGTGERMMFTTIPGGVVRRGRVPAAQRNVEIGVRIDPTFRHDEGCGQLISPAATAAGAGGSIN